MPLIVDSMNVPDPRMSAMTRRYLTHLQADRAGRLIFGRGNFEVVQDGAAFRLIPFPRSVENAAPPRMSAMARSFDTKIEAEKFGIPIFGHGNFDVVQDGAVFHENVEVDRLRGEAFFRLIPCSFDTPSQADHTGQSLFGLGNFEVVQDDYGVFGLSPLRRQAEESSAIEKDAKRDQWWGAVRMGTAGVILVVAGGLILNLLGDTDWGVTVSCLFLGAGLIAMSECLDRDSIPYFPGRHFLHAALRLIAVLLFCFAFVAFMNAIGVFGTGDDFPEDPWEGAR